MTKLRLLLADILAVNKASTCANLSLGSDSQKSSSFSKTALAMAAGCARMGALLGMIVSGSPI